MRKSKCTSLKEHTLACRMETDHVVISGSIIVPNPCYRLKMSYEIRNTNTLCINLFVTRLPGFCIQCIAEIPFEIIIRDLPANLTNIIILYRGKVLNKYALR